MNQQGTKISNESIFESYLRPLTKQGVINSVKNVINAKENLYILLTVRLMMMVPHQLPLHYLLLRTAVL